MYEYLYVNVGDDPQKTGSIFESSYSNVGWISYEEQKIYESIFANIGREYEFYPILAEYLYTYLPDTPALGPGPNWFGVDSGETQWMPGAFWNGKQFVRYKMWDGLRWQYSSWTPE